MDWKIDRHLSAIKADQGDDCERNDAGYPLTEHKDPERYRGEKATLLDRLRELGQAKIARSVGRVVNKPLYTNYDSIANRHDTAEFKRILALPRRKLDLENVIDLTGHFRLPGGTLTLHPVQSAALIDAAEADGLVANVGVGRGKTLIGLLMPEALDAKQAVYLVESQLRGQLEREIADFYGRHFRLPLDRLRIVTYHQLSSAKTSDILENIGPDLIIIDEAHRLARPSSARTKRFLRYMRKHPECRIVAMSGTLFKRSIMDFAHFMELALRKNSPLPKSYPELKTWSAIVDTEPAFRLMAGALRRFCKSEDEPVQEGFRRRLIETPGVVATQGEDSVDASLFVRRLDLDIPESVQAEMRRLKQTWCIGDEELEDAAAFARVQRELACGFYYQWVWPNGEKDQEWIDARRDWNKEVRERLKRSIQGQDSPMLLFNAAMRYHDWVLKGSPKPAPKNVWASDTWEKWVAVKGRFNPTPPSEPVWIDDFVVDAAIAWAHKQKEPAIIWYIHKAVGERIAGKGGFPHYGAGTDANESRDQVIVASIDSQGQGKNLQHFSKNLLTSFLPNGTKFEQVSGRTHRFGQKADSVQIDWYGHTHERIESMRRVYQECLEVKRVMGQPQKILYADKIGWSVDQNQNQKKRKEQ